MNSFPQYRKYSHTNTYIKIVSEKEFIEISFIGTKKYTVSVAALHYPEFLRIQDMITCKDGIWHSIAANDFEKHV